MAKEIRNARFCNRIDTSYNWNRVNSTLLEGELGIVTDSIMDTLGNNRSIIVIGDGAHSVANILESPLNYNDNIIYPGKWAASSDILGSVMVTDYKKSGLKLNEEGYLTNAISSKYNDAFRCFEVDKLYVKDLVFNNKNEAALFSSDYLTIRSSDNEEHVTPKQSIVNTLGAEYFDGVNYFSPVNSSELEYRITGEEGNKIVEWKMPSDSEWKQACKVLDLISTLSEDIKVNESTVVVFLDEENDYALSWNGTYRYEEKTPLMGGETAGVIIKNTTLMSDNSIIDSRLFVDGGDQWHVTKYGVETDILSFESGSSGVGFISVDTNTNIASIEQPKSLHLIDNSIEDKPETIYDGMNEVTINLTKPVIIVNGNEFNVDTSTNSYDIDLDGGLSAENVQKIQKAESDIVTIFEDIDTIKTDIASIENSILTKDNIVGSNKIDVTQTEGGNITITHKNVELSISQADTSSILIGNDITYSFITSLDIDNEGHLIGYTVSHYKFTN